MKKHNFAILAMATLSSAILMGAYPNMPTDQAPANTMMDSASADMKNFYATLSPDAKRKFDQLDPRAKKFAIEMSKRQGRDPNQVIDDIYNRNFKGQDDQYIDQPSVASPYRLGQDLQDERNGKRDSGIGETRCGSNYQGGQSVPRYRSQGQNQDVYAGHGHAQMNPETQAFYGRLSVEGRKKFDSLSTDYKLRAMEMAQSQNIDPNQAVANQYERQINDSNGAMIEKMDQMQEIRKENKELMKERQQEQNQ